VRFPALLSVLAAVALWSGGASADCEGGAPCVDAEPLWLTPSARHFTLVSDTTTPAFGKLGGAATIGFRYKPVVLDAPAPNAAGREINLIRHTTDLTAGLRVGIGSRMELTLALPAGLYQRGAGIKGVTHQSAPPISEQSLHDPRLGFGYALPYRPAGISSKLRLELKLPLGDEDALMGDQSFVVSPTLPLSYRFLKRWFFGGEIGARMRRPVDFFGRRVGTQLFASLGVGYELPRPQLSFAAEVYSLRTLVAPVERQDVAAEWQASVNYSHTPRGALSVGLSGGTGIPALRSDGEWQSGIGTPLFRALVFARWVPASD
jgi:hypothetical protein